MSHWQSPISQRRRRAVVLLTLLGVASVAAAAAFPELRAVLLALGGTGLFASILLYLFSADPLVPAVVGESIYSSVARNADLLGEELDFRGPCLYVPADETEGRPPVRLFIPTETPDEPSSGHQLRLTSNGGREGLELYPVGTDLFEEFRSTRRDSSDETGDLVHQLSDGLVSVFELAENVTVVSSTESAVQLRVDSQQYGPLDQFDHPITSFLGVGLAAELNRPIRVTAVEDGDEQYLVTCRYADSAGEG